jgi:hypothetical protein
MLLLGVQPPLQISDFDTQSGQFSLSIL